MRYDGHWVRASRFSDADFFQQKIPNNNNDKKRGVPNGGQSPDFMAQEP